MKNPYPINKFSVGAPVAGFLYDVGVSVTLRLHNHSMLIHKDGILMLDFYETVEKFMRYHVGETVPLSDLDFFIESRGEHIKGESSGC